MLYQTSDYLALVKSYFSATIDWYNSLIMETPFQIIFILYLVIIMILLFVSLLSPLFKFKK